MILPEILEFERKSRSFAKPFVKWVGGKTQLLSEILSKVPSTFLEGMSPTYVEPFVGGGAVLFSILKKYPQIERAVINDINPDLIATYRCVRDASEKLIEQLSVIQKRYLELSDDDRRAFFGDVREQFNSTTRNDLETATFFIFLNRTCFNGLYRVNSSGKFNVPFGKHKNPKICDPETIRADSEILQRVEILEGDFEQTLTHAHGNVLFYLDPPYKPLSETSSFNSYAKEGFYDSDQIRLGKFCREVHEKGFFWILSNSDVRGKNPKDDFFDELYKSFNITRVWASRIVNANAEKRGKLTELLITNY